MGNILNCAFVDNSYKTCYSRYLLNVKYIPSYTRAKVDFNDPS